LFNGQRIKAICEVSGIDQALSKICPVKGCQTGTASALHLDGSMIQQLPGQNTITEVL